MKRICLMLLLLLLMLTGCKAAEPATVATISPGPASGYYDTWVNSGDDMGFRECMDANVD